MDADWHEPDIKIKSVGDINITSFRHSKFHDYDESMARIIIYPRKTDYTQENILSPAKKIALIVYCFNELIVSIFL